MCAGLDNNIVSAEGTTTPTNDQTELPLPHNDIKPNLIQATGGATHNVDRGRAVIGMAKKLLSVLQ